MPIQNESMKPILVGFTTPCIKKTGPSPMIIVPEIVVAVMMLAPMIIGRLPTMPNMIMTPMLIMRTFSGVMPTMPGRSREHSLPNEVKVESSVDPAVEIMITATMKNATMPRERATMTGASDPLRAMPSRYRSTPTRENNMMAMKPRMPAMQNALSIFFSSQRKPRSVRTASWKP